MLFDRHWYWKRIVRRDPKYQGNLHQQQEMSRI
jgi:MFS transporter, SP family, sugar:H+ symporter